MCKVLESIKKSTTCIPEKYDPKYVEEGWYEWWETKGIFVANKDKARTFPVEKRFTMVLPPPNVTGSLHIGHALTIAIQDCLARWKRMNDYHVLWIPGTDHAGIATQSVVERKLLKDRGMTKNDIGRDELVKLIWEWKDKYGGSINNQIKRMGASLDWTREVFTLDHSRSQAVTEAFVRFHKAGILYRDARLVCLSPALSTVISDIEVDIMEVDKPQKILLPGLDKHVEFGYLWIFKYFIQNSDEFIPVATSRIETMLGDVGVAVHPGDSRYSHLIGKKLVHPFIPDREMCVIADEYVDKDYGTGAVKLTPAHDKHDFDMGKRHNLPLISIFDMNGRINNVAPEFQGMHRFNCREVIEKKLTELGHLVDKISNPKSMQIPICSRSGDVIEYIIVPQWWVNCKELAKRAVEAVRTGELEILPSSYVSVWIKWLENIQDWCISRQLWWGHRIPAYQIYLDDQPTGKWIISHNHAEAAKQLKTLDYSPNDKVSLVQDEDVLDTWFSSGLAPLSFLGWPAETECLELFFPTTVLETGNDILFFWVARMVMMSLELVNKVPFKKIYLHPLVRDAKGEKMSKSKGNVIDPLEVADGISLQGLLDKISNSNLPKGEIKKAIEEAKKNFPDGIPPCGSDSLRLGLLELSRQSRAICLNISKIIACRHFCNKLWNATKVLNNYKHPFPTHHNFDFNYKFEDQWILHRLYAFSNIANESLDKFNFSDMVQSIYQFWLHDFCDVYLELIKSRLVSGCKVAAWTALVCMDNGLRLIHPVMPYVSEQLYQQLPLKYKSHESISMTNYPQPVLGWVSDTLEVMDMVKQVTHSLRSFSNLLGFDQNTEKIGFVSFLSNKTIDDQQIKQQSNCGLQMNDSNMIGCHYLNESLECIRILSKFQCISLYDNNDDCVANNVNNRVNIYIKISHLKSEEVKKIRDKISAKLDNVDKMLSGYKKKLLSKGYDKVPDSVKQLNNEKIDELSTSLTELQSAMDQLNLLSNQKLK